MTENIATPRISSGENLLATLKLPEISLATNEQILDHLRHSHKIGAVAADAEQEILILRLCEQLYLSPRPQIINSFRNFGMASTAALKSRRMV
jgi:hypothetical protein